MGFGQAISHNFSNMTNFSGRAGRGEFWWWILFIWILSLILNLLTGGMNFSSTDRGLLYWVGVAIGIVLWLATLAVTIRRLHDTGRSGWWVLLYFICCIGGLVVLIFCIQPSQPQDNQYGAPPA